MITGQRYDYRTIRVHGKDMSKGQKFEYRKGKGILNRDLSTKKEIQVQDRDCVDAIRLMIGKDTNAGQIYYRT